MILEMTTPTLVYSPCIAALLRHFRRSARTKAPRGYSWVYVRQYCAKIDEAARNRIELIVQSLAEQNGVTEQLKADTKWSGYGR